MARQKAGFSKEGLDDSVLHTRLLYWTNMLVGQKMWSFHFDDHKVPKKFSVEIDLSRADKTLCKRLEAETCHD